MNLWWIFAIVVGAVFLLLIILFNTMVVLRNRINNAWAQIDVQLKRRIDLIPNLIETVKGYAKHEKTVFKEVTEARTSLMKAGTLKEKAKASNQITEALKTIFAVAENYPQLKANENFLMLQEELSGTESKIAYARQFYNDTVLSYNNTIQKFPGNMFASMFGFKSKEFFEISATERKPVKVQF